MRLTAFTDYALRTMIYLALHPDRLVTIAEISGAYGLSRNHVMKIVQLLAGHGLIVTLRGKNGGLRLARPAAEFRAGEIVRVTEPDMAIAPCFAAADCVIQPGCRLAGTLSRALNAFMGVLDATTLADLAQEPEALRRLLGSDRAREGGVDRL